MKPVLHLITTIERGGAENQLMILVRGQAATGREVHVAYLKGNPELEFELKTLGVIVHGNLVGSNPLIQLFKLQKLVQGKNWIIHAHLPRAELLSALSLNNCKLIISRHNAEPFFPKAPQFLSKLLSLFVCKRASSVIAISNAVKNYLQVSGEVSRRSKIDVVHYGYIPTQARNFLSKDLATNPRKLGTVSRLAPQKDLHTLLYVFKEYKSIFPNSSLSIVGGGPSESEIRNLSTRLGLDDSITFEGRSNEVLEHIKSWDIFLLTSKYEGFGLVLLEAMDASVPIIAASNSAIPEVMGDNFPGLGDTGNVESFLGLLKEYQDPAFRRNVLKVQESRLGIFTDIEMRLGIDKVYKS